jgi:hypothetical protein
MTDDWKSELWMKFAAYTYKKVLCVPVVSFLLPYWHTFRICNQGRNIELESVFILSTLAWADCSTYGFYLMLLYNEQTLQIYYVLYLANGRSSLSFCSIYIVWRKSVIEKLWKKDKTISEKRNKILWKRPGDRFTKVIVIRKSKITLTISLRARIRGFNNLVLIVRVTTYDLRQVTSLITEATNISYHI